jgi:hypothetical protein
MRNIVLTFLLSALLMACSKHKDPGPSFTSVEGKWKYSTPDSKINIKFDLVKVASDSLTIQNQGINVNGTDGNAAFEINSASLTSITYLRINANSAALTYPYNIVFTNGTVSGDFKKITFINAVYTWPYPSTQSLTNVEVTRQ